jgi:hypothetical protein
MTTNILGKYSFGVGDRFAQQAAAQLAAVLKARRQGIVVTPVWNKSFREHSITKSEPLETRMAVDRAVKEINWTDNYFVDADHVTLDTVDRFIPSSDYFTIDVADYIGKAAPEESVGRFVDENRRYAGELRTGGPVAVYPVSDEILRRIASRYLIAVEEAGKIYRRILEAKQGEPFVVEVSMDEAESAQTPVELLFILAAMAAEHIPVQAIAPKFSGRFNKGIDYVGDVLRFQREFEELLSVIRFAVSEFNLPEDLKISVHTGSDKFSIYPLIGKAIRKYDAGIHIKTAGTTWLEELIGLAEANEAGLAMARDIYAQSLSRLDELISVYTAVIDIDPGRLPAAADVGDWDGKRFAETLRHDPACPNYNPHFRQLLHVGFKIAADMGEKFLQEVRENAGVISGNVTENIYTRHLLRLFA